MQPAHIRRKGLIMPEIDPLTAEEIIFVRRMVRARRWIMAGLFTALGAALFGVWFDL